MLATVLRPEATPDSRAWRRLRRRTLDAADELAATFDVLRREPPPGRAARRLVQAAVQLEMKPQDTLLFDLDRRPADDARGFLSKRSLTRLEDTLNPAAHHHLVGNKLDYHVACAARGVAAPPVLAVIDLGPDDGRRARLGAAPIGGEAHPAAFLGSSPGAAAADAGARPGHGPGGHGARRRGPGAGALRLREGPRRRQRLRRLRPRQDRQPAGRRRRGGRYRRPGLGSVADATAPPRGPPRAPRHRRRGRGLPHPALARGAARGVPGRPRLPRAADP